MEKYSLTNYRNFSLDNMTITFEKKPTNDDYMHSYDILKNNMNVNGIYLIDNESKTVPDFIYDFNLTELKLKMKNLKDFSFINKLPSLEEIILICDNSSLIFNYEHQNIKCIDTSGLKSDKKIYLIDNYPKLHKVEFSDCDLENIVIECKYIELVRCKNINIFSENTDTIFLDNDIKKHISEHCILYYCENIINVPNNAVIKNI